MTRFKSAFIAKRRILPDGFYPTVLNYPVAEWLADFDFAFPAFFSGARRRAAAFLHTFSLVLPGDYFGGAPGAHVFCHCRVSPLFFAPLVQDQPRFPVHHRLHGDVFFTERCAVVGGAPSPPSSLFRPGTGFAFADAFRLLLVAHW